MAVLKSFQKYRARNCNDLYEKSKTFVLRHFTELAYQSQEILDMSLNDFFEIINDDMLNTKDEGPVWECCLRWINHNVTERRPYITKLMRGIRLGLLDTWVNNNPLSFYI